MALGDGGADSEEHEKGDVDRGAAEEDCPAAEVGSQGDGEDGADESETGVDEAELEGEVCL